MDTELYRKGQARVDEANKQALSGQVGGALTKEGIISQNGTDPITSQTLASTPSVKLPVVTPTSNPADAIIASTQASADQFQKEAERVVAEQNKGQQAIQQERETTLGKIKGLFGQTSELQTQRAEAEKQADPFRTELANINKEIADQNVALRGETDAIMARGDVSKEGQQSLLQNVKDTYGRRLADLAIRQSAANENVTALETALDRKLELATASIKNDIEYYTNFELENLNILKEDQKQRVKDIIAEKNKQLETVTKKETAIADVLKTASENKITIPDNVVAQIQKAGSALEAYQILAKNGISLAKAGTGGFGDYTDKQLKAITKLNQDVSKNSTYTKTTSMRNYGDNVVASLSLGTGVGDISAINQFQKVIDEGAVTRDQDVKLIQSSQSLADTLKTKIKKLEKGEQLSPELRKQMREAVEAMYEKQVEALQKDPYIKAKTTEAGLYGLTTSDTILGELGGFTNEEVKTPEALRAKYQY